MNEERDGYVTWAIGIKNIIVCDSISLYRDLQQLFNAADVMVIGRFVGKHAMAAVGSNSAFIGLMVNLFVGISLGANVIIARYTGQGNKEKVHQAVHMAILVA